jgi:hypothetical protein
MLRCFHPHTVTRTVFPHQRALINSVVAHQRSHQSLAKARKTLRRKRANAPHDSAVVAAADGETKVLRDLVLSCATPPSFAERNNNNHNNNNMDIIVKTIQDNVHRLLQDVVPSLDWHHLNQSVGYSWPHAQTKSALHNIARVSGSSSRDAVEVDCCCCC